MLLACFFFSRAGTFEMHQAENVLECVKFYMPQDQFPGIAGERYSWFVDITPPPPSEGPAVLAAARDGPTSDGPTVSVPDVPPASAPDGVMGGPRACVLYEDGIDGASIQSFSLTT